jgi:serine/threonine protein phosphatase PrpC
MVKESIMVTCPKCKAENRPEAAFCSRCGTILFAQPAPGKPAEQAGEKQPVEAPVPAKPAIQPSTPEKIGATISKPAEAAPALRFGLQPRPDGTIFGDRFRNEALHSQEEHEILYTVSEILQPGSLSVQICSNPECRTIHCPAGEEPEKYCTQCGHSLEERSLLFSLEESDLDQFSYIPHVLELHLVHPNIHPPVASFEQEYESSMRYYLAVPQSANLPPQPEISDVLEWGIQLAGALDYLQSKGVVLGDELDLTSIGLVENRAVWRNFTAVRILPMLTDREKINNLRMLCLAMYSMMTGHTTYSKDPYLPAAINSLFEKALVGEGITSGADLIQQIETVKSGGVERLVLDYQVGRSSHPGKIRGVNEDSLLCAELCTYKQGGVQPNGLFAVADGMGGHAAGDQASSLVIQAIIENAIEKGYVLSGPMPEDHNGLFKEIVQAANQVVYEARQKAHNDMGSTLALCYLNGTTAYLTHQGDSRIYLISEQGIDQLTTDHSLVQHMVSIGQITAEEAHYHPQRNVIYRSLGDKPYVEVECTTQQLFPHDRILLCTDGLTNQLDDEAIKKIILEASSPQVACNQLVEAANATGGEDNISVILVEIITV